jgi:hypothetical protein
MAENCAASRRMLGIGRLPAFEVVYGIAQIDAIPVELALVS